MKRSNIYIDYDATLVDFTTAWIDFINLNIDKDFNLNHIKVYDQQIHSDHRLNDVARQFWKIKDAYDTVKPFDGAVEFIEELMYRGHYVQIITSTDDSARDFKNEHILSNFVGLFDESDISHVSSASFKWPVSKDGIFIDDFILSVLNHSFNNRMPGIVYNHNSMHSYVDVVLNNKVKSEEVYKIDSKNLYYATSYKQILDIIEEYDNDTL